MKRKILIIALLSLPFLSQGQLSLGNHNYGEDALKYSQITKPIGTARSFGLSGALSALGGDAASVYYNPAGVAFYNRNEFSMSLDINNSDYQNVYIGNTTQSNPTSTKLSQLGGIFSNPGSGNRKKRSAFGLSYNLLKNFNSQYNYSGVNNKSSIQDYFATVTNASGKTVSQLQSEFDKNTWTANTPEAMYYYAYLIEPNDKGGYYVGDQALPVQQYGENLESGGLGQFTFSYGINLDDKNYLGAAIGIQNLTYNQLTDFKEVFPTGGFLNQFTYRDNLTVSGAGFNLTVGGIFRVAESANLGVSITTPTFMSINEILESSIRNLAINDPNIKYNPLVSTIPNEFQYNQTSPLRGTLAGAYYLPKKIGLLSLEGEFVGYKWMNVKDSNNGSFKTEQKALIQTNYKNVFNLRGGLEFRINKFRVRGGANYLQDPYRLSDLDRSQFQFTTGLGFRNEKFFADLGYGFSKNKFAFTPYQLSNPADYSSVVTNRKNNDFRISAGMFF